MEVLEARFISRWNEQWRSAPPPQVWEGQCMIVLLDHNLLQSIFALLDYNDLCALRQTCSRMRSTSHNLFFKTRQRVLRGLLIAHLNEELTVCNLGGVLDHNGKIEVYYAENASNNQSRENMLFIARGSLENCSKNVNEVASAHKCHWISHANYIHVEGGHAFLCHCPQFIDMMLSTKDLRIYCLDKSSCPYSFWKSADPDFPHFHYNYVCSAEEVYAFHGV